MKNRVFLSTVGFVALGTSPFFFNTAFAKRIIDTPNTSQSTNRADADIRQDISRADRRAARLRARRAAALARTRRSGVTTSAREGSTTVEGGDIIVTGLRESVSKSIDRKRKARQIVDVVTAEDAGKLPDNNVVEAMARVTGITVTRSRGRANGFNIRGLAGVQTTINGIEGATE